MKLSNNIQLTLMLIIGFLVGNIPNVSESTAPSVIKKHQEVKISTLKNLSINESNECYLIKIANPYKNDIPIFIKEIVLKDGATAECIVPHARENQAFMMGHLSYWEESVVEVLCNKWGSADHHTKTSFAIIVNEKVGVELCFKLKKMKQ